MFQLKRRRQFNSTLSHSQSLGREEPQVTGVDSHNHAFEDEKLKLQISEQTFCSGSSIPWNLWELQYIHVHKVHVASDICTTICYPINQTSKEKTFHEMSNFFFSKKCMTISNKTIQIEHSTYVQWMSLLFLVNFPRNWYCKCHVFVDNILCTPSIYSIFLMSHRHEHVKHEDIAVNYKCYEKS